MPLTGAASGASAIPQSVVDGGTMQAGEVTQDAGAPQAAPEQDVQTAPPINSDEFNERQYAELQGLCMQAVYGGGSAEGELSPAMARALRAGARDQPHGTVAKMAAEVGARAADAWMKGNVDQIDPASLSVATLEVAFVLMTEMGELGLYEFTEEDQEGIMHATMQNLYELTMNLNIFSDEEMRRDRDLLVTASQDGSYDQFARDVGAEPQESQVEAQGIGAVEPPDDKMNQVIR